MRLPVWIPALLLATACAGVTGPPSAHVGDPGRPSAEQQWSTVQRHVRQLRQGTFSLDVRGVAGRLQSRHRGSFDLDIPVIEEESRDLRGRLTNDRRVHRRFPDGTYEASGDDDLGCWDYHADGEPYLVLTRAIRLGRLVDDPATPAVLEIETLAESALRLLGVDHATLEGLNPSVAAMYVPVSVQLSRRDPMAWLMVRGKEVMADVPRGSGLGREWEDYLPHAHSTLRASASDEPITLARPTADELCPGSAPPVAEERGVQNITVEKRALSTKPTFS